MASERQNKNKRNRQYIRQACKNQNYIQTQKHIQIQHTIHKARQYKRQDKDEAQTRNSTTQHRKKTKNQGETIQCEYNTKTRHHKTKKQQHKQMKKTRQQTTHDKLKR